MHDDVVRLRDAVQHVAQLRECWVNAITRRCWALQGQSDKVEQLREHCGNVLEALRQELTDEISLHLGDSHWREPLHLLSFTAGWLAGADLPISAALALCYGLQDAVGSPPSTLYEQLVLVTAEAYNAGLVQQASARHRSIIEKSQVVCMLDDRLPCLFLVGDPDRQALDDALGRLMMVAVMRNAPAIVVDTSGLLDPMATLPEALRILADHRRAPPPRLILSSVTRAFAERLETADHPEGMSTHEQLFEALTEARALTMK